ncbi:hypothetical protein ACHAQH_007380 [Verticillium albo-atrum]
MVPQRPTQTLAPITTAFFSRKAITSNPQSISIEYPFFENETSGNCLSPEYAPYEVLDVREDPSAKPSIERPLIGQTKAQGIVRADSGLVVTPVSELPLDSLKPLAKADSGYSSNVSLRSFSSKKAAAEGERPTRTKTERKITTANDISGPVEGDRGGTGLVQFCGSSIDNKSIGAPSPPVCSPASTGPPAQIFSPWSPHQQELDHLHSPSSTSKMRRRLHASSSYIFGRAPERSENVSPVSASMSPTDIERSSSALSIGGNINNKNKLQRLLSGARVRGPPAVHPTHSVQGSIPSIPRDVEAKLNEHTGQYPMMSKQLTMHHYPSKDTLKTILSVGSVEAGGFNNIRDSLISLDKVSGPVAETPKSARRRSLQPISSSISQAAASVMSRKSIRRKPVSSQKQQTEQSQDNELIQNGFESSVTSIDSIRNGVGKTGTGYWLPPPSANQNEIICQQTTLSIVQVADSRTTGDFSA